MRLSASIVPRSRFVSARGYEHLILATGARARPAPFADADLAGVVTLRNLNDADQLKQRLEAAQDVVVVGAGFIGLGSQPRRWPRQTRHSRGSRAARHWSRGLAADFRLLCDSPSWVRRKLAA